MKFATLTSLLTVFSAAPALAGPSTPSAVLELFTSQGCSSCPKANKFVADMDANHPDVLVLSYGVTYWDYLGWKDTFGHTAFTDRQRQYDTVMESGMYTPMMVVAGRQHAPRLKDRHVTSVSVPESVQLVQRGSDYCIEGELPVGAKLAIVDYTPGVQSVPVKKGENRGRTLSLANVVTGITYADWSGARHCGLSPEDGLAVLAHDPVSSAIIGAARYERTES